MARARAFALILTIALSTPFSTKAFARGEPGVVVGLGLFGQSNLRERSARNDTSGALIDARIGWAFRGWLFIGASYGHDLEAVSTRGYSSEADNAKITRTRSSYGPTIGAVFNYGFVLATAHLASSWDVRTKPSSGESDDSRYLGRGAQIDIGVTVPLGPITFGPQLSYKHFEYDRIKSSDSTLKVSPRLRETRFEPLFSVMARF